MHKDWAAILGRALSEESAYKSLFDYHSDLIIVLDRQGRYVESNREIGLEAGGVLSADGSPADPETQFPGGAYFAAALEGEASGFKLQDEGSGQGHTAVLTYVPVNTDEGVAGVFVIIQASSAGYLPVQLEHWLGGLKAAAALLKLLHYWRGQNPPWTCPRTSISV